MANAARLRMPCAPATRHRPRRAVRADEFYVPKPIDNSRLVKVADPGERRQQKLFVLAGLLLFAGILAGACQRFAIIREGYRIEDLKSQRDQLLEANRHLRLEEASLRDPERVDAIARRQLGLGVPAPGQVGHLERPVAEAEGAVVAQMQPLPQSRSLKVSMAATVP